MQKRMERKRILFLGDIVGKPGRKCIKKHLPEIKEKFFIDLVIANAENASGGLGLTSKNARELHNAGIDILTSGNHIWKYKEINLFLEETDWLLRPLNYPSGAPGKGVHIYENFWDRPLAVLNLQGRVFMEAVDCPFRKAQEAIEKLPADIPIIVDFHAEATSEKKAMGYFLQGRVTALIGTHTHIQTNDAQLMAGTTGYITDVGMCGPKESVLGMEPGVVLQKFQTARPVRFELAKGSVELNGVIIDFDLQTGHCLDIQAWKFDQTN